MNSSPIADFLIFHEGQAHLVPRDAPDWYMWAAFGVFFWISYVLVRALERQGIHLRL